MADKSLKLTIQIAGALDSSLTSAINQASSGVSSFSKILSSIGTAGLSAIKAVFTGTAETIVECTNEAEKFANAMGDVTKYVSGLADANGEISDELYENGKTYAENYEDISDAILELSTQIPYTYEELAKLTAAAGQSGYNISDLIQYDENGEIQGFLKDVAMVGTALDISAEQAGDWAAKWEKSLNMTHEEVMELFDQINYLGAHNATTAAEIAQAVNDSASLGQVGGISASTTAALSTAMLATGVSDAKVSTSLKRMITNISMGDSASKSIQDAFASLGMDPVQVAKDMQAGEESSNKTLMSIFEGIANLPNYEQVATIKNLFGQWAIEGGAKIVGNLDVYRDALAMVQDPETYEGSMEREFAIKQNTPEAINTELESSIAALKIDIGDEFLPVKTEFNQMLIEVLRGVRENMPSIVNLASVMADGLSSVAEVVGNAIQFALPYIDKLCDYVSTHGEETLKFIGGLTAAFAAMSAAPIIETGIRSLGTLLFGTVAAGGAGRTGGLLARLTANAAVGSGIAGTALSSGLGAAATQATAGTAIGSALTGIGSSVFGPAAVAATMASAAAGGGIKSILSGGLAGVGTAVSGAFKGIGGLIAGTGVGKYALGIGSSLKGLAASPLVSGLVGAGGKALGATGEILGGIAQATGLSGLVSGVAGKAGGLLSSLAGSASATLAATPFEAFLGSKIGGLASGAAGLASGAAGMIASGAGALGQTAAAGAGVLSSIWAPVATGFAGIVTGAAPVVAAVSGVIAVFSILGDTVGANMDNIRTLIGNTFGETGLTVFDTFMDKIQGVASFVQGLLGGGLITALNPVRTALVQTFGPEAGAAFGGVAQILQSIVNVIGQVVTFATTTVKPIIQEIFTFVTQQVFPIILQVITTAAPIIAQIISNIGTAVMTVMQTIGTVITAVLPVIENVISVVMSIAADVIPVFLTAFNTMAEGILTVVQNVQTIFDGLIEFITGVFTGNWQQAWEGVKTIFGGIFGALTGLVKAPINAIIGIVNSALSGIGGLVGKLPQVVKDAASALGFDLSNFVMPQIPLLAKGGFTSGPSIAGEAGTEAVISFMAGERRANIATWAKAGQMLGVGRTANMPSVSLPESGTGSVTYAPQITINGNADRSTLEDVLAGERERFERWYQQMQTDSRRRAFA